MLACNLEEESSINHAISRNRGAEEIVVIHLLVQAYCTCLPRNVRSHW